MTIASFGAHNAHLLDSGVTVTTNKQRNVTIRPGGLLDAELLAQMYRRLSARTINLRYGAPRPQLPEEVIQSELARILGGQRQLTTTLIGTTAEGVGDAVAVAELVQSPDDQRLAEMALLVSDDYQREGLGRALSRQLYQEARSRGVRLLRAYVMAENVAMMRLIRSTGARYSAEARRGVIEVEIAIQGDRVA